MKNKLIWLVILAVAIAGAAFYFKSMSSAQFVWDLSEGGKLLSPLILISALVDSINPCAFSILLLTIAFLFSVGRLRSNILKIGLLYILGIFVAYFLIGLGILQALHLFNTPNFMAKVGAALLVAFGILNITEVIFPKFPIKLRIPHGAHGRIANLIDRASVPTAFGLGALVGICEFPCTGGPYLMVLGLLHDQATFWTGFGYLILYNLVFVFPLVVILLIASNQNLLGKVQEWQKRERHRERLIAGAIMVALGIFIFLI